MIKIGKESSWVTAGDYNRYFIEIFNGKKYLRIGIIPSALKIHDTFFRKIFYAHGGNVKFARLLIFAISWKNK